MNRERRQEILDLYQQGFGGPAIAKKLGIHVGTAYYYLKNIDKPNGGHNAKTNKQEIINLYEQGLSCQQIADKVGLVDGGVVWNRLKKAGVKIRSKSEGMDLRGCRKIGTDQEIIRLYQSGWSQTKIAQKYDVYPGSIVRILNKYDINEGRFGKRNPAWKGGRKKLNSIIRESAQFVALNKRIMQKLDYTCQISGTRGGNLHIHHIVELAHLINIFVEECEPDLTNRTDLYDKINKFGPFWNQSNLLLVSEEAHRQIHGFQVDWPHDNKKYVSIRRIAYRDGQLLLSQYHYLGTAPKGSIYYGLFWKDCLIGVCSFGRGANKNLSSGVGGEALELTRLCIVDWAPKNSASYFISKSMKLLRNERPNIQYLVAFSDPNVGHTGGVYRACNWKYVGQCRKDYMYELPDGQFVHKSKFRCKDGFTEKELAAAASATKKPIDGKHKYIYCLRR